MAVSAAYWLIRPKWRNTLLLAASYAFYASWNWKLLGLIWVSTAVDYICSLKIHSSESTTKRRIYFLTSIIINLSLLGFFKYCNFFIENLIHLFSLFGFHSDFSTLNIILPIGISFYTFQTMSYTIDIYRRKLEPTKNIINFALFVGYFPQLLAGPIEKAKMLIPQIEQSKLFKNTKFYKGAYLFLYGLFKKIIIADSIGIITKQMFSLPEPSGAEILLGIYAFSIQLYCDFSGYSDMARGISHFFGIKLSRNFHLPFFSKSPLESLRRWHITLYSWLKEYVYLPLLFFFASHKFFRSLKKAKTKVFIGSLLAGFSTLFLSGLWHGADWNYILMGIFQFTAIVISSLIGWNLSKTVSTSVKKSVLWIPVGIIQIILTFHISTYSRFLFGSDSVNQIALFTRKVFSEFSPSEMIIALSPYAYSTILLISFLFIYEFIQYIKEDEFFLHKRSPYTQIIFYLTLFFLFVEIGGVHNEGFVYFQF